MPLRRLAVAVVVIGLSVACHSGASGSLATSGGTTTIAGLDGSAATTSPPVTEPAVTVAKLQSMLLRPADLPAGFAPGATTDDGRDVLSLPLCGQALVATGAATAAVTGVLVRSQDHLRVVERVEGFSSAATAGAPLAALSALGQTCHGDGATRVSAFAPPAVGESVAGIELSGPTGVRDVALVRSGPITVVIIVVGPGPIPAATVSAVVQAAGTNLAVGTGG